jgi:hypothetical protein
MSVPNDAVSDAADKGVGGAGLTMTAHDNKIRIPLFSASQDQSLRRSVIDDELEFSLFPASDFSDARRCRFSNMLNLQWKLQRSNPADVRE